MNKDLIKKIEDWVISEGLPLEYFTNDTFKKNGFRVFQGHYIKENGVNREVDVQAIIDTKWDEKNTLRIYNVIECKWSKDKPWVIFTSDNTKMAESACISQCIGNEVGQSSLWHAAGERNLWELDIFKKSSNSGFGGRQAFSNNIDALYNSLQSIVNKTVLIAKQYDHFLKKNPFEITSICFPIIVVDGLLYETSYDTVTNNMIIKETNHSRINWRGADCWDYHAMVDIVTKDSLNDFVIRRHEEIKEFSKYCVQALHNIRGYYNTKNISVLNIKKAPRGFIGYPEFIRKIKLGIV